MHGIYIVLINVVIGKEVLSLEYQGVVFSIIGVFLSLCDSSAHRSSTQFSQVSPSEQLKANLINLGSALFGALYFLMNASNVNSLPIMSLIFVQNVHLWILNSLLAKFTSDPLDGVQIFSMDKDRGCLGFLDPEIRFVAFIPYGIFSSVMGSAGYVMCLLFYSPLVVSNAYLIEPLIAQIMAYCLHIDDCPGLLTLLGGFVIVIGIMLIDKANRKKSRNKWDGEDSMTNTSAIMDGSMYYHNNLSSFNEPSAPITHDYDEAEKLQEKWHVEKDDENNVDSEKSEKSMISNYSKLSLQYFNSVTR